MSVALIVSEKNGKVTFLTFDLDNLTLTLDEGHCKVFILKHLATIYHRAKFDVCSFNSFREKWQLLF